MLERADELRFSLSSLGRNLPKVSGFSALVLVLIQQKFIDYYRGWMSLKPRSRSIPQLITHSFLHDSIPAPVISEQDALPQSRGLIIGSV